MWGLIAELGIEAGLWALNTYLQSQGQDATALTRDQLGLSGAREGTPVPIVYGYTVVRNVNLVYMGALQAVAVHSEIDVPIPGWHPAGPVDAYEYFLPMVISVAIPGGDYARAVALYQGTRGVGSAVDGSVNLDSFSLYSAIAGNAMWYGGSLTQLPTSHPFWAGSAPSRWAGVWASEGEDPLFLPRYKGIATLWLFGGTEFNNQNGNVQHNGFNIGNSPQPEPYSVEVFAPCAGVIPGYSQLGTVGPEGDANPANVLWDLFTNPWSRGALPTSLFDATSFGTAGTTLASEGHGISLVIDQGQDLREVVKAILAQIDGQLYMDPFDGKVHLKLIRNDYNPASLITLDESNSKISTFGVSTWEEVYNRCALTFTERGSLFNKSRLGYVPRTVFEADPAVFFAAASEPRLFEVSYPWCLRAELAQQLAARDLKAKSRPLRRASIIANRDAIDLRPGSVFKLNFPSRGINNVIMRVGKVNVGKLNKNAISITCAEDVFATSSGAFTFPVYPLGGTPLPYPITERIVDEAPRWLQYFAKSIFSPEIADIDQQHLWYLAVPNTKDVTFTPSTSTDGETNVDSDSVQKFPSYFTLATDYARELDPYDTATGISINGLSDTNWLTFVTAQQIQNAGLTLFRLGNEIMAFEQYADAGGGNYTLQKVWRGLLDTVPVKHTAGERGYPLARIPYGIRPTHIGSQVFNLADVVDTRLIPASSHAILSPRTDQPLDEMTIRARTTLPYPCADMTIGGSKTPTALEEGGITVGWRSRDRLKTTITRGDASSETTEAGISVVLMGQKTGKAPLTEATLATGITPNVGTYSGLPLGRAGHGVIAVRVRTQIVTATKNWQEPEIDITAYHWRNHLLNGDFSSGTTSWTVDTGSFTTATSGALGGNGSYLQATSLGNTKIHQTQDIAGYQADGLTAQLHVYAKNGGGNAADTLVLTLLAYDINGTHLGSDATSTVTPSTTQWQRFELAYANLPAGTAKIEARLEPKTLLSAAPSSWVTRVSVRVGQPSSQLLSNPSFETGTTGSWTVVSGTFTVQTTAPYEGADYVRCDAAGTLRQDVNVPAGWEYSAAILEVARGQDNTIGSSSDWPAEVKLQALDGSNNVLATATTGSETISGGTNTYQLRRLHLDLPDSTAKVRVDYVVSTGTNHKAIVDDFRLRLWKDLDPRQAITLTFDTPQAQPLPSDLNQWVTSKAYVAGFGTTPIPTSMWDFTSVMPSYGGTLMKADAGVLLDATFTGLYDPVSKEQATTCCEFPVTAGGTARIRASSAQGFAKFSRTAAWSVGVVLKAYGETNSNQLTGICGRMSGTSHGWGVTMDNVTGDAIATLRGASANVTVQGGIPLNDGAPHFFVVANDPNTNLLHLIDEDGTDHTVSHAAIGVIDGDQDGFFEIGGDGLGHAALRGQIARIYVWDGTTITSTQAASIWKHGTRPAGLSAYTRVGRWAIPVLDNNNGVAVVRASETQYPLVYLNSAASDGTGYVLPTQKSIGNLIPTIDFENATYWTQGSGAQITFGQVGPEGFANAANIHHTGGGSSTDYLEINSITLGAGNPTVQWFYRNPSGVNSTIKVELVSATGTVIDTYSFSAGTRTTWLKATHTFTWTNPTATGKLRFYATSGATTQDIVLSPLIGVYQLGTTGQAPIGIPTGAFNGSTDAAEAWPSADQTLPLQFNSEGEIYAEVIALDAAPVVGTLVNLRNGTNNNDRRHLHIGATAGTALTFDHYDGSAANTGAGATVTSYSAAVIAQRGRWARAGILEKNGAVMSQAYNPGANGNGRVAAWTPSATQLAKVDIGHANGTDIFTGGIRKVKLTAREQNVIAYAAT